MNMDRKDREPDPSPSSARQTVVFFDGVCGLCNRYVDFLLRIDAGGKLRFAPLQGQNAADKFGRAEGGRLDSIALYDDGRILEKSDAVIRIFEILGGVWRVFTLLGLIPKSLRDRIYEWTARNRYRVFGKRETCRLPAEEERSRFLD